MADIAVANSTYSSGTNDTSSTLVNNVTATDAQQWNGVATAVVGIETILGTGTTLKGSAADLVARLAVLLQASGAIKDVDAGTTYTKWDQWAGYGTATLKKRRNGAPPGEVIMWGFTGIPAGFLELDSSQNSCTLYEDLLDNALADLDTPGTTAQDWRRGTANHTLAQATDINTGTETLTKNTHGLANGTVVHVSSSTTIPPGLVTRTKYFIVGQTANTYQLSLTLAGSAVDITGLGTGTLSVFTTFQLPDWRGRSPIGAGTGSTLTNRALNVAYGEETHTLTEAEMPAHTHQMGRSGTEAVVASIAPLPYGATNFDRSTRSTGGDVAHNTIHPVFTCRYLVRY